MQRLTFVINQPPEAARRHRIFQGMAKKHNGDRVYQATVHEYGKRAVAKWETDNVLRWDKAGEFCVDVEFSVHDLRPRDKDNLLKNLYDGLNGTVWKDDKQVVDGREQKRLNRDDGYTIVTVTRVSGYLS